MKRNGVYIDGEWRDATDELRVRDLADDATISKQLCVVTAADEQLATQAIEAANSVEAELKQTTLVERAEWMEAISEELECRSDELTETIVREAGKPISSARGEVESAIERFGRAAEEVRAITGEYREGTTKGHEGWQAIVKTEPIGTTLAISPYNYPLATTVLQVAPALGAGNPVVLKPASQTPVSSVILADAIDSVDAIPDGVFSLVVGESSEIGDTLAGSDLVEMITMTGSSWAGKHVAEESGMTKLHMELGGNAPAMVFPDADISEVGSECSAGSLKYAGQRCSAVSRILAHGGVYDEVVSVLESEVSGWGRGDLFDESTVMGPLIDEDQAKEVEELVEDAVEKGARIVCGGERDGAWFEPTLLADVPHDADIITEEQFGPVAVVTEVGSEEGMLEIANSGDLALDASVFTKDHDRAMRVADAVDAGAVRINGAPSHGLGDIPFGGNGASGMGRQGLHLTIEEMMVEKSIIL